METCKRCKKETKEPIMLQSKEKTIALCNICFNHNSTGINLMRGIQGDKYKIIGF